MSSRKPWAFALLLLLLCGALASAQPGGAPGNQGQDAGLSPYAACSTFACVAVAALIYLAVKIAVVVFVYRDAKARGANATLWLLLCLFTDVIGLIIWLIVRPAPPTAPPT